MTTQRALPASVITATAVALLCVAVPVGSTGQSAEPVKKSTDVVEASKRQAFSVVLLLGDMQGGESVDGVPVAARKALVDTKDFLPYKNYRLLDSQWTLCCSGNTSAITRLRGVDDQEYELELRASPISTTSPAGFEPSALSIRFVLREFLDPYSSLSKSEGERTREAIKGGLAAPFDARAAQINQELFTLERERTDLVARVTTLRKQAEVGVKDPAELKRQEAQLALVLQRMDVLRNELNSSTIPKTSSGPKAVIDTSFRMDVGETVVVGTSGLRGGSKALIALLTAVSKPTKGR